MNILPSIAEGYMFNEMANVLDDTKQMTGGLPISKLVGEMEFISHSGGAASRETPTLARLENLAVPIGLVYKPHYSHHTLKYEEGSLLSDGIIDDVLYDKLVDMVSVNKSNKTRKHHSKGDSANKTYRLRR